VGKGTGLGLPMVHGLVQESGGQLILHSQKGRGTTAELWFPIAEKLHAPRGEILVESAPQTIAKNLTVLVVDDDPLVLTNMGAMLADLGHKAFEAASAREALDILRREKSIELVLTDHAMPRMTGFQLIEQVQKGWPHLPVILATGFAELPLGLDPQQVTLAKPFTQHDLAQAVAAALSDPHDRKVLRFRGR
jgi:CheY-like chemotaxis protein